jgi:hypothetical protein
MMRECVRLEEGIQVAINYKAREKFYEDVEELSREVQLMPTAQLSDDEWVSTPFVQAALSRKSGATKSDKHWVRAAKSIGETNLK